MTAYYNEIDKYAAQWLRNLITAGHIAPGIVDERSIEDVYPSDLRGFTQCHFFAGIGVWSHALRAAGWSDDRPVWTGSCPCQPFSAAGQGAGFDDERHLWPHFHHLIKECRPAIVLGEQVASKDADPWIDLVCDDLEALGYSFGAIPFPSAGVGAPHIRDRLYWVGDSSGARLEGHAGNGCPAGRERQKRSAAETSVPSGLANLHSDGCNQTGQRVTEAGGNGPIGDGTAGGLADTKHDGCGGQESHQAKPNGNRANFGILDRGHFAPQGQPATSPTNGYWRNADWLLCRDGRWRPVEPGTFPLVNGAPARVGRLRAYGNAICAKAAQVFIECVMDCTP
jgi:DNA (cytosine-5)-methyltransferase 1